MEKQEEKKVEVQGTETKKRAASKLTMLKSLTGLIVNLKESKTTSKEEEETLLKIRTKLRNEVLGEL